MGKTTYWKKPNKLEKLSRNEQIELMFDLVSAFCIVRSPSDTIHFLEDLLSAKEIKNLSKRLRIAKMLLAGQTHLQIVSTLHCSFATVSKVNMWLSDKGRGFKYVIAKLPLKYEFPKNLPPMPLEFQLPHLVSTMYAHMKAKGQRENFEDFFEGVEQKERSDRAFRSEISKQFNKK